MAKIQLNMIETHFEISVPFENFLEFKTPEIIVGEIPWIIRICKLSKESPYGKRDWLNAYLDCTYKDTQVKDELWWIEAAATLKLITFNKNNDPVEKIVPKTKFNDGYRTVELSDFLPWEELIDERKSYTEIGEFTIKGVIMSTPLRKQTEFELTKAHFGMLLQNVKSLTTINSKKVNLRGVDWYVVIGKAADYVTVHLNCNADVKHFAWSHRVSFTAKLMTFCDDVEPLKFEYKHRFFYNDGDWGWLYIIKWDTFLDKNNHYVRNDQAFFEFSIDVEQAEPVWKCENASIGNENKSKCPICFDTFDDKEIMATICGHLFCGNCIKDAIKKCAKCPLCNAAATVADLRIVYLHS